VVAPEDILAIYLHVEDGQWVSSWTTSLTLEAAQFYGWPRLASYLVKNLEKDTDIR